MEPHRERGLPQCLPRQPRFSRAVFHQEHVSLGRFHGNAAAARECEGEGGPLSFLRLDPDAASMTLYDLLADGKTKSGPLALVPAMQPLEDNEHPLVEPGVQTDAVVTHGDPPEIAVCAPPTTSTRGATPVLRNFRALPIRFWKSCVNCRGSPRTTGRLRALDFAADSSIGHAQVRDGGLEDLLEIHRLQHLRLRANREYRSSPVMNCCIRFAPSTAYPMNSRAGASSCAAYRRSSNCV